MKQSTILIVLAVCTSPSLATLFNFKQAQRREPAPVYGPPASHKYPGPPPDVPPPPAVSYSIPIQQYGPPKLNFANVGGGNGYKKFNGGYGGGGGGGGSYHGSFVNFKGPSAEKRVAPKPIYGPPRYGSPQPNFFHKKPAFSQKQFGPRPVYGPPLKTQGCDGWTPIVGPAIQAHPLPAPQLEIHAPAQSYGPPQQEIHAPAQSYGPPQVEIHTPADSYGPPPVPVEIHAPASSYGPPPAGLVQQPIIDEPHAPLDQNLHLPDIGPPTSFLNSLGVGGGYDIVKSEGIEVNLLIMLFIRTHLY